MNKELQALQDADFGWVQSLESVWSDERIGDHIGPNNDVIDSTIARLSRLTRPPDPPARVLLGQAGIGKTHLMGELRRRAWAEGCWFVLLDVVGITDFWKSAALSFVTSLLQEIPGEARQDQAVIGGIAKSFKIEHEVKLAFESPTIELRKFIDLLIHLLMKAHFAEASKHKDVFRAIALLSSQDIATVGIAHAWLQGYDADEQMRKSLGFLAPPPSPVEIVKGVLWVMGLAAPTLVAVDQIDGVISASSHSADSDFGEAPNFAKLLGGGLLDLARSSGRGMLLLTCLLSSWEILRGRESKSFEDSFEPPIVLRPVQSGTFARRLISDRLAPAYIKADVVPKSATWPFTDEAIVSAATGVTPRTILMRCDAHRRRCLSEGKMIPCNSLVDASPQPPTGVNTNHFDKDLSDRATVAELNDLLDARNDGAIGALLRDIFDVYAKQISPHSDHDVVCRADPVQRIPPLHARLTFIDHRANDSERHYCVRAVQHENAVAVCARLRAALTASGVSTRTSHNHLIIVRRGPPPSGPKTQELFKAFRAAGGIEIDPSDDDLRTFVALREMRDAALAESRFDAFERWLIARKPLCDTDLLKEAGLCPPPLGDSQPDGPSSNGVSAEPTDFETKPVVNPPPEPTTQPLHPDLTTPDPPFTPVVPPPTAAIPIGRRAGIGGEAVELPTSVLPRHTAIIAGAGSGKTVLLRRIVEEAALAGIPAIVIDPNNDLSRLGDPWPGRPENFTDEDATKAARYAATVEVVVWTPGVHAGNPLFLSVLPDFAAVGDDPDERAQAVTMAVDTLGPLAGAKTNLLKGVLSDALRHFARTGGTLKDMTALLAELPEGVSEIGNAEKLAAKMADELKAAVATNPLLQATGPVLDPKLLFYGPDARRTRISVINLSGLASDEAKEDFVNRLQMTLFGWVKKHPSPRGMLYVIDEAQVFIPSGAGALSKTSGVQLVAQARKYGLGMIAVTQAPKGIDNKVVSNCTTQFLGKQNAPATIDAAKELIAASGGKAEDIGKLVTGEFYFKTENSGKPFKLRTPICLSWHPPNPPTPDEVVARAKRSKGSG